ncbi:hypothetical protein K503DRAFT_26948 [Rhizopogon vinicolor AM-OR11-026]|uniref:Uncharacterized protein n=1 Tax=Rhizopogon vinicolor AM-OR11-026 TaxID=1314800 RepID=A0A1B7MHD8_9AGAM|nr:hypothetical protein K503DRAFT_26948 [Rhizopogon vinicolor AM-OR11-026]
MKFPMAPRHTAKSKFITAFSHERADIFDSPPPGPITHWHVSMLGLVYFMCPGMFTALTGLGGRGQVNPID